MSIFRLGKGTSERSIAVPENDIAFQEAVGLARVANQELAE